MKLGEFEGYLGEAAEQKHLAKQAIKDKRFDDAWGFLHEQKIYYLKHATANKWNRLNTLVLESSPHKDMANILRIEGKHKQALTNMAYVYAANYHGKRPLATLEKKLEAYFNRVYKNMSFKKFLSMLKSIEDCDYIAIRDFAEIYFPMAPSLRDKESLKPVKKESTIPKQQAVKKQIKHVGIAPPLGKTTPDFIKRENKYYPEPKYVETPITSDIQKNQLPPDEKDSKLIWLIPVIILLAILILTIWIKN